MQFGFSETADVNISSIKSLLTEHHVPALTARRARRRWQRHLLTSWVPLYSALPLSVFIVKVTDDATKEARGCDTPSHIQRPPRCQHCQPSLRSAWPIDQWYNWKPRSCQGTWGVRLWRKDLRAEGSLNLVRVGGVITRLGCC